MMAGLDLDEIYAFAKALGRDAGNLLQQAANRRINGELRSSSTEKESSVDIVTQVCTVKTLPNDTPLTFSQ